MASTARLNATLQHLAPSGTSGAVGAGLPFGDGAHPREEKIRIDGWGYSDSQFALTPDGEVCLTGDRYLFSGHVFP
eukprot:CAMPEP_0177662552 /NCGR_PEP_ID=MMETSP0447-20121125/19366_1 /TAXON_ID=0 /ORGANISM="Stygamoeba regulata, Strain BSH-02190019" /LENGTH=75 /DNA_ID=CAMNT_0019168155 /DNA_START=52 /DNA_END=276 /DNA_ORIENTATION=+